MKSSEIDLLSPVAEAAGGLLWRPGSAGREIAVIHRERYNDWTLPKGKRKPGETWQETALREIYEETACRARLEAFAGVTAYSLSAVPKIKIVLFWHMTVLTDENFEPNEEVDDLVWLQPPRAKERLSYDDEKALLRWDSL